MGSVRLIAESLVLGAGVIRLRRGYGGQVAPGYSIWEKSERGFQHARCTKPSRRVRKDLRAAFAANSDYSDHGPRLGVRPHLVLRKILSGLMRELQQLDSQTRISRNHTN